MKNACKIPSMLVRTWLIGLLGLAFISNAWAQTWTQELPTSSPPARVWHAMAYDAARSQVVLFGGITGAGDPLNDTWVWDGVNWTQKFPAVIPSARGLHTLVYDAGHQQVLMFGGFGSGVGYLSDTWVWNGTDWQQLAPQNSPSPSLSLRNIRPRHGAASRSSAKPTGKGWPEPAARAAFGGDTAIRSPSRPPVGCLAKCIH